MRLLLRIQRRIGLGNKEGEEQGVEVEEVLHVLGNLRNFESKKKKQKNRKTPTSVTLLKC